MADGAGAGVLGILAVGLAGALTWVVDGCGVCGAIGAGVAGEVVRGAGLGW